jgi:hypothetical protein
MYRMMNSSNLDAGSVLARQLSRDRVGKFLVEVANLRDDEKSIERFIELFSDFLPSHGGGVNVHVTNEENAVQTPPSDGFLAALQTPVHLTPLAEGVGRYIKELLDESARQQQLSAAEKQVSQHTKSPAGALHFFAARKHLRDTWRQPTTLGREIELMGMVYRYASGRPGGPEIDNFTFMMLHALRFADRMRYCGNPTCAAPYFLARRRSQKYCSDACSLPAQREHKRAWWSEHGEEWRQGRKGRPKGSGKKAARR